jgi:hypothetical protein
MAIIPIQSVFILPFLLLNLPFLSIKNPRLNIGHGFTKIPSASATRLSQEPGTRGFPRLPHLWGSGPPTDFGGQVSHDYSWFGFIGKSNFLNLSVIRANSMPKMHFMPNYRISMYFFKNEKFASRGDMPFFVSPNCQSFDERLIFVSVFLKKYISLNFHQVFSHDNLPVEMRFRTFYPNLVCQ